jgi:inorganic pyrophosphatase
LEPQSELEETKEKHDFIRAVKKECKNFLEALANYEIAQVKDISDLTKAKDENQ